jgi:hypothetical protein
MSLEALQQLQAWFAKRCDGEWEHDHGISVQSTDNPGWWVKISLSGTPLASKPFDEVRRGDLSMDPQPPWLRCYVEDGTFNGAGDVTTLGEILTIFLEWAADDAESTSAAE